MATNVILPMLGETMQEGTITSWLKQEGDEVSKGEPLFKVETDKANIEVESPASGILRKIIAREGETVPVMEVIAIIGTADEPIDLVAQTEPTKPAEETKTLETAAEPPTPSIVTTPTSQRIIISPRACRLAKEHGIALESLAGCGTGPGGRIVEKDVQTYIETSRVKATPLAAKIAAEQGLELRDITGTGPRGKVTREDVLRAAVPASPTIEPRSIPFTGMRKAVADNVAKSAQTAPHVTLVLETDMTEAVRLREQILEEFEKKYGTRLTITDLIVKAVAHAIPEHPIVNASLQDTEIRIHRDINIGVAVAIESGLVVPVVQKADKKSLAQISAEIKMLAEKARTGKLMPNDMSGGTFTVSNLGPFGIDSFNPIIVPGQSAILGICRIVKKPAVVGEQITIQSMMNLCLSFDHRVMDGVPAAQFLNTVKKLLEAPYQLLI